MAYTPVAGQAKLTGNNYAGVFTNPLTAGNLVIFAAMYDATATPTLSKTSGTATLGTITRVKTQTFKSNTCIAVVFVAAVTGNGTCTLTGACAGSTFSDNAIHEFSPSSGTTADVPSDQSASAGGSATPAASGSTGTTTQAAELIFGYAVDARSQTLTSDSGGGYTQLLNSNPNATTLTEYKSVSSTGTYSQSCVVTGTPTDWASIVVTIMEPASSTTLAMGVGAIGLTGAAPILQQLLTNTAKIIIAKA